MAILKQIITNSAEKINTVDERRFKYKSKLHSVDDEHRLK